MAETRRHDREERDERDKAPTDPQAGRPGLSKGPARARARTAQRERERPAPERKGEAGYQAHTTAIAR
jgi:hypothetical protein